MNEPENKLKKALAENGVMDAEKTERLAAEAVSWFESRQRWLARSMYASILAMTAVVELGFAGFVVTYSTKGLLVFTVLLLVGIGFVMLSRLEYVVMSTKIGVLKEIKLLRLESRDDTSVPGPPSSEAADAARRLSASVWKVLSRGENLAWIVAVAVVAMATMFLSVTWLTPRRTLAIESHVTLAPDGAGIQVSKVWYSIAGPFAMTSSQLYTRGNATLTRWIDNRGRELPIRTATIQGNKRYTVQLLEPVMPGDEFHSTTTVEIPKMAVKQGDVWTCVMDPVYGYDQNNFLSTVQLPKGAQFVSSDPAPDQQLVQDALPTLRFQATRQAGEKFVCKILYRLPNK